MGISPGTNIGETAISVGVEAGYNLLALAPSVNPRHRLYLFGRYDYYDPMLTMGRTAMGCSWPTKSSGAASVWPWG